MQGGAAKCFPEVKVRVQKGHRAQSGSAQSAVCGFLVERTPLDKVWGDCCTPCLSVRPWRGSGVVPVSEY